MAKETFGGRMLKKIRVAWQKFLVASRNVFTRCEVKSHQSEILHSWIFPLGVGKDQKPLLYFYRPQTKFAKVMFSQVSVCPQGGGCLPHCMLGYRQPPPPWADTHPGRHPSNQCMLGYSQQEDGMHPTGMHSC